MADRSFTSVYLYFGVSGYPIYVGVTDRGTRRLHEHADDKPWWPLVVGCTVEHFKTREDALDREEFLIAHYRPAFNYQHNPDRGLSLDQRMVRIGGKPPIKSASDFNLAEALAARRDIKDRRNFFYSLTTEQKRLHPCIVCGIRSGNGRPMCAPCLADDKVTRLKVSGRA